MSDPSPSKPGRFWNGESVSQICIGQNEIQVRSNDGAVVSIERDLRFNFNGSWIDADYNSILSVLRGKSLFIDVSEDCVLFSSETGALKVDLLGDGYESVTMVDGQGAWVFAV